MKKIIILVLCIFLTGCTHYVELSSLDIISNMGIDYYNDEFHILITTVSKDKEEKVYQTYTSSGKTMNDAILNIQIQGDKKFYMAHLHLLVLTPKVVTEVLEEVLNFFLENTESRNDFSMAITDNIDILKEEEDNLQNRIQIVENDLGITTSMDFEGFICNLLEERLNYLPIIKSDENIEIEGITLLNGYSIIGELSMNEVIIFNIFQNNLRQASIYDTKILSSQTFLSLKNDVLKVNVECVISSDSKDFENKLENGFYLLYEKFKLESIDIFELEEYLQKEKPLLFKSSEEFSFEDVKIDFQVLLRISKDSYKGVKK